MAAVHWSVLGVAGLGLAGIASSLFTVEGGHRAIIFNRNIGVKDKVYTEGTHFRVPWIEKPIFNDIRAQAHHNQKIRDLTYDERRRRRSQDIPRMRDLQKSTFRCRDLSKACIGVRVIAHPNPDQLVTIHQTVGDPYFHEKLLHSIMHDALNSVVERYNAIQLITQGEDYDRDIRKEMAERASQFNIVVDDVAITSISPWEINSAIGENNFAQIISEIKNA